LPNVSTPSPTVPVASLDELGGWPAVLSRLTANTELPPEVAAAAFTEILEGRATPAQVAGFAIGLRTKGETVAELTAVLRTMLAFAVRVPLSDEIRAKAICTCGTGGDRSHSINISTTATFLVAGAGGIVCKHGGRAASSQSGSADVLEALGVALEISPAAVARCVTEVGVGFCLAPRFHPAMRHAAPTRRELGVATLFNFIGPMANPGLVRRQAVGVSDPAMAPRMAEVLRAQGADRAVVMHGHDGLDELSTTTTSSLWRLQDGVITESVVDPCTYGFERVTLDDLRGGTAVENAVHVRNVLAGRPGPHRDVVVLNAAAGLLAAGVASDLGDGVERAAKAIDDGSAMQALDSLIRVSNEGLKAES
jgi:anthranilate phosphoribosyltransferase